MSWPSFESFFAKNVEETVVPKKVDREGDKQALLVFIKNERGCSDCGVGKANRWCSLNLGLTCCLECAGFHRRNLGVHLSWLRHGDMDLWKDSQVRRMLCGGNSNFEIWLSLFRKDALLVKQDKAKLFQKYDCREASLYRKYLDCLVDQEEVDNAKEVKRAILKQVAVNGGFTHKQREMLKGFFNLEHPMVLKEAIPLLTKEEFQSLMAFLMILKRQKNNMFDRKLRNDLTSAYVECVFQNF